MIALRLLVTLFLLVLALPIWAQPVGSHPANIGGTSYLIAWPDTTANGFDSRYPNRRHPDKAYIQIYSAVDNRVWITGEGYDRVVAISAGTFRVVDLMDPQQPAPEPIVMTSNLVSGRTFRIEAEEPVVVYCYLLTRFGTEAWTPLPVDTWGREYFVAARAGEIVNDISVTEEFEFNAKSRMAPAEITIIAAYDNTSVTITPSGDLLDSPRIADVIMNAGEVYQVRSLVDTSIFAGSQPDIGGSHVIASKPIGVISGNTRS